MKQLVVAAIRALLVTVTAGYVIEIWVAATKQLLH